MIRVDGLTKTFGNHTAVDNVSFEVAHGQMVGLVGPNGAGKTTIIHTLLGLITPDEGRLSLFGMDLRREKSRILQRLNFVSPYVSFPAKLTVTENLCICAGLYGVRAPGRKILELLELFSIAHLANRMVGALSSGEVTRMALCKAFLSDPELLLLDEPTAYMDPFAAAKARATLLELQKQRGVTVLFTSHNMRDVQEICSDVIILHRGRIKARGSAVEVTRAVLQEDRQTAALDEVFLHIAAEA